MPETKNKKPEKELHEPLLSQFGNSALGEIAAFSIAIGAVYATEKLLPEQTERFIERLAGHLGKWRGTSAEMQSRLAKKMVDVGIMNVAGASGMAIQFGLRRSHQPPDGKTPLWYEAGRLAAGRVFGTVSSVGALAIAGIAAPGLMKRMEESVSGKLGASARSDRFAELFITNTVQSIGAIAGNAPAQLLYDHVVRGPEKRWGSNQPHRQCARGKVYL